MKPKWRDFAEGGDWRFLATIEDVDIYAKTGEDSYRSRVLFVYEDSWVGRMWDGMDSPSGMQPGDLFSINGKGTFPHITKHLEILTATFNLLS